MSISISAPLLSSLLAVLPTTIPATTHPALDPVTAPLNPTTQVSGPVVVGFVAVLLLMTLVGIALFIAYRVWDPRTVIGPRRLPERGKTAVLLLSLGVGLFAWLGTMVLYGAYKGAQLKAAGVTDVQKHLQGSMSPRDLAILSTAPQIVAFALMLAIVLLAGDSLASRLGLSLRKLPRGVGAGVLAFLVTFPMVMWGSVVIDNVYRRIGFSHPAEHELLKSFGQARQPWVMMTIVLGATVCAPIFEELLFRAHLQTLLRQLFLKLSKSTTEPRAAEPPPMPQMPQMPVLPAQWGLTVPPPPPAGPPSFTVPTLSYVPASPPAQPLPLAPQAKSWPSWLAILFTSIIFGLVHPLWMSPLIFLLSLGLGYIYERTGILWASVTVHLLFNSTETLQYYLMTMHGH
jgi:membrane protease YdiL (CAAX protease family)